MNILFGMLQRGCYSTYTLGIFNRTGKELCPFAGNMKGIPLSANRMRSSEADGGFAREIGTLMKQRSDVDVPYPPGQVFVHKLFEYRGIVVCSFPCLLYETPKSTRVECNTLKLHRLYQVLIHRGDWLHMRIPIDLTSYLSDCDAQGARRLNVLNGMDCVMHDEIIPYRSTMVQPVEHELFRRVFERQPEEAKEVFEFGEEENEHEESDSISQNGRAYEFRIGHQLEQNYFSSRGSWLAPKGMFRETTDGVQVTAITFFLGSKIMDSLQRHCWRYVMRLENLGDARIILRERFIKIFGNSNIQHICGRGAVRTNLCLSPTSPVFQCCGIIDLSQLRGAHMWGKLKFEREDGSLFEVRIPTVFFDFEPVKMETNSETERN